MIFIWYHIVVRSNINFDIFIIFIVVIHYSCDTFFSRKWPRYIKLYGSLTHNQITKHVIKNFDEKRNKSKFNKNLGKFPINRDRFLFHKAISTNRKWTLIVIDIIWVCILNVEWNVFCLDVVSNMSFVSF